MTNALFFCLAVTVTSVHIFAEGLHTCAEDQVTITEEGSDSSGTASSMVDGITRAGEGHQMEMKKKKGSKGWAGATDDD